jgi:hypothetical protein
VEGYEIIRTQHPDLVLLDNRLAHPDPEWYVLAFKWRSSAASQKSVFKRKNPWLPPYAAYYLEQPFDADALRAQVKALLEPLAEDDLLMRTV